jgi:pectinesterase inhibitor-like protein
MKSILFLILAVPFLGGAAGERCSGVTSMAVEAACQTACGTRLLYDMCMDTLREDFDPDPSVSAEVTLYALHAAQHALESYLATVDAALELIKGSLGRDERAAYDVCVGEYGYAENSMRRVAKDMLPRCKLVGLGDEFMNGLMHLEKCRDLLIRLPGSPLYARNLVDRNKDLLAYSLGNLLVM